MSKEAKKPLRCAIYTRVSTDSGLEQEFNSLDAQREAAEAYVKSQAHEGWRVLPAAYNDGGFSGGSMDRPALQQLLDDIRHRLVDVVVVYKVDRLTRSLADFSKLVELFDANEVSFVSVTQAFNTTTSMGRLTLNVLLSFAQFEREVTGERIRDKIAASKRKGLRVGGPVPLGYDVVDKKLVINREEAERVRTIYRRYLELGSLTDLMVDLRRRNILTKRTVRPGGKIRGGIEFTKGPLAHLLKNRVYVGEIVHKDKYYVGEHQLILDLALFDAVQQMLASQARSRGQRRINNVSFLTGLIYDDRGNRMTPSTANKAGVRYRYYVSCAVMQARKHEAGSVTRISAPDIETVVAQTLRRHFADADTEQTDRDLVQQHLDRIVVRNGQIDFTFRSGTGSNSEQLTVPWAPKPTTVKREIIAVSGGAQNGERPIRAESRARLIEAIGKARAWVEEIVSGRIDTVQLARREGCSERSLRMTLSLAFLSPTLAQAAMEGTLPYRVGVSRLLDLPPSWDDQLRRLC
jgi:site-specific DNA recombinase